jgi:hypothetical protein
MPNGLTVESGFVAPACAESAAEHAFPASLRLFPALCRVHKCALVALLFQYSFAPSPFSRGKLSFASFKFSTRIRNGGQSKVKSPTGSMRCLMSTANAFSEIKSDIPHQILASIKI